MFSLQYLHGTHSVRGSFLSVSKCPKISLYSTTIMNFSWVPFVNMIPKTSAFEDKTLFCPFLKAYIRFVFYFCNISTNISAVPQTKRGKHQINHGSVAPGPIKSIVRVWHLLGATSILFTSSKSISPNASRRRLDICNSSTSRLHVWLFGVHTHSHLTGATQGRGGAFLSFV